MMNAQGGVGAADVAALGSVDPMGACEVCRGRVSVWSRRNDWTIVKCRSCGHGSVRPRPDASFLTGFYASRDHAFEDGARAARYRAAVSEEAEPRAVWSDLRALGVRPGRLLDVGAGNGRFTAFFLHRGFAVTALEPDPVSADRIERRLGVRVVRHPFEAWNPDEAAGSFDVIVLSQVVEHILSPRHWLEKCRTLLCSDGVLVVSTPNFSSLLVRILGDREGHICPPEHVNYFTGRALGMLGRGQAFDLIRLRCRSFLPRLLAVEAVKEKSSRIRGPAAWAAGSMVWLTLKLSDPLRMGRYLYAYYKSARA
jgi:2-polyprenyl-3-methyl-5-hydroxy-6-metoxy-1,4-benzoquinol methylase